MSDRAVVVRFENVGKMYKIFSSRSAHALDFLGLARVLPSRRARYREFWALRGIDLELRKGERLGVIGRNGAGKTTLLKLVTGNLAPTEGIVEVDGEVQALLEIGGGLHPEFTGRENIRAALVHLGLSATEIEAAEEDIADFTELGSFLDQPFKSYSLGMQARLSLAIATTVQPEILIIDEILGAGDAYFFAKSTARMRELLDRGASVLLVSHALDQVQRFCERTIWLERGHIVMEGETAAVVGAYEQFIRELDDRRLRALNARALSLPKDSFDRERHIDTIGVRIDVPPQARLDVSHIVLCRDDEEEDRIAAGDAQDAASGDAAGLVLVEGSWDNPSSDADRYFRSLDGRGGIAAGSAEFQLWFYYPASTYAIEITHRLDGADAEVSVSRNGQPSGSGRLVPSRDWQVGRIEIDRPGVAVDHAAAAGVHWPGVGDLVISTVGLLGEAGETAVFEAFSSFKLALSFRARRSGSFIVIPAALIFRWDGVLVTRHVAREEVVELNEGDVATAQLDLGALRLGNGRYVVTVGLYRFLDPQELAEPEIYDVVDRSYEFEVVGHPRLHNELFHHPGEWTVDVPVRAAAATGSEGGEDA